MASVEIHSFVLKLETLLKSGRNANLSIEGKDGKVAVTLRLEDLEVSPHGLGVQQHHRKSRNVPAKQRRRERRAAALESAAEEVVVARAAQEAVASDIAEEATQSASDVKAQPKDSSEEETSNKTIQSSAGKFRNDEIKDEICPDEDYTLNDTKLFQIKGEYRNPNFKPWDKVDPNADVKVLWEALEADNESKGIKEIGDGSTCSEHCLEFWGTWEIKPGKRIDETYLKKSVNWPKCVTIQKVEPCSK